VKFYELFLTWRYLTRRPLSLVAVICLGISVAVLVVAPSIMNGFQTEFHKRIRGTLSDLTFASARPFGLPEDAELEAALGELPHVEAVAPYLENPALDKHLRKIDYCFLRGVEPRKEARVSNFEDYLMSEQAVERRLNEERYRDPELLEAMEPILAEMPAEVDLDQIYRELEEGDPRHPDLPTCVVGIYFMIAWDLRVGDTVLLTTASQEGEVAQDVEFVVVGAFSTGFSEKDRRLVVMSLENLQEFCGVPGKVSGYSMRLGDYARAHETKDALKEAIRPADGRSSRFPLPEEVRSYYVKTWEEHNVTLLRAVAMEKLLIRLMTFLIVVAASATIFLVLFLAVYTKVRELGILRAVGGTASGVLTLFVGQGFLMALLGMVLGLGLGILFSQNINEIADFIDALTGWHPFPPDVYYLDRIPTRIDASENLQNFAATLVIGSLAAFLPGLVAALKPPLKAIRYE